MLRRSVGGGGRPGLRNSVRPSHSRYACGHLHAGCVRKLHVSIAAHVPRAVRGTMEMTQDQFSAIMFHLKAMLGLVCLQAAILVGFAWKYL